MEIDYRFLSLRDRKLLYEYGEYLVQHRGIDSRNVGGHYLRLRRFLRWVQLRQKIKIHQLRPEHIQTYLTKTLRRRPREEKKEIVSKLRGFLKYLHLKNRVRLRLDRSVPKMAFYKHARVPSYLTPREVERLLRAPDRRIESGRRDYAMLLLMARYGVRLSSVKYLCLKNIDWRKNEIFFPALKYGKSVTVPLLPEVAKAILDYIRRDRGNDDQPEVFLTILNRKGGIRNFPRRRLSYFNHMSQFKHYYVKAGINSAQKASHILRHSFATNLLRDGVPIKNISHLLGHAHLDTTQIYTKVDIENLRSIAPTWPKKEAA